MPVTDKVLGKPSSVKLEVLLAFPSTKLPKLEPPVVICKLEVLSDAPQAPADEGSKAKVPTPLKVLVMLVGLDVNTANVPLDTVADPLKPPMALKVNVLVEEVSFAIEPLPVMAPLKVWLALLLHCN